MLHKSLGLSLKNLIIHILYVVIVAASQYLLVTHFISEGLSDPIYLIPFNGMHISILFHLIPINVALILLLDLIYLMRSLPPSSRTLSMDMRGRSVAKSLTNRVLALVSRKDFESAFIAASLFHLSLMASVIALSPSALYNSTVNLYLSSGLFRGLIKHFGSINAFLIGFMGSSAISFRRYLQPLIEALMNIDVVWKYLLCQNIAAWLTSIVVLMYVRYRSKTPRK